MKKTKKTLFQCFFRRSCFFRHKKQFFSKKTKVFFSNCITNHTPCRGTHLTCMDPETTDRPRGPWTLKPQTDHGSMDPETTDRSWFHGPWDHRSITGPWTLKPQSDHGSMDPETTDRSRVHEPWDHRPITGPWTLRPQTEPGVGAARSPPEAYNWHMGFRISLGRWTCNEGTLG